MNNHRRREPLYRNFTFVLLAGFGFFVIDYVVKNLMVMQGNTKISLMDGVALNFVPNTEMAFSIPVHQTILIIAAFLILLGLIQYFTICCRDGLYANVWALNFIIWGAFSNLYDRLTRGFVVDYVDIGFWPVFNLSDVAIIGGFIALFYFMTKQEKESEYSLAEA